MGGVQINGDGQVLHNDVGVPRPIVNLYAAGEVTGGVHGRNRLAGNSLLECVVFGRRAGRRAAESARPSDTPGAHWRRRLLPLLLRRAIALAVLPPLPLLP